MFRGPDMLFDFEKHVGRTFTFVGTVYDSEYEFRTLSEIRT